MKSPVLFHTILFLSFTLGACQTSKSVKKETKDPDQELTISIPQNSGLALVNYKIYSIHNDHLFVIDRNIQFGQKNATQRYDFDTIAIFKVDASITKEINTLFQSSDTLGNHTLKDSYGMLGYPRFFISVTIGNRHKDGFIGNCYNEYIFKFVDLLNKAYPKGKVLDYDKDKLVHL